MANPLGNLPPTYHLPAAVANQAVSSAAGPAARLLGATAMKVSVARVRHAEQAAKATIMNFLERHGQPSEYERLTSLTGE